MTGVAHTDWLPTQDRGVSPYTGWTRAHWEAMADALLTAVRPHCSPRHGLISLPGPASVSGSWSDGLEGFARTFLLAAFRLARSGDADPRGLAEWYADGLAAGTDPASPERWPTMAERHQAKVEAASVAIALHESRPFIWDRLSERVRQHTITWLRGMVGTDTPDNNWVWFKAIVNAFLHSVDGPWSPDDIENAINRTEEWYVGAGWYSDGPGRNFDYYCGWALQFYPLWLCRIVPQPGLLDRYRERLTCYLRDAQHLVAPDGAPLIQGRSLTYRFAMLAPFWAGAAFEASPLPPGRTRRLASGVLRHFLDAGRLDEHWLLPLGWHSEFPAIRQSYSGPASPYWAAKAFAGLVLPERHPVWTATEEPLPIDEGDVETTLHAPGWVVSGTHSDGIVRIVNHGTDHKPSPEHRIGSDDVGARDDPVYARHGYATHAAPDMGEASRCAPIDSHVALLDAQGRPSHRGPLRRVCVDGRVAVSRHHAAWPCSPAADAADRASGSTVTTASVLRGACEVRLARIDEDRSVLREGSSDAPAEQTAWRLRIGGWSVAAASPPRTANSDAGAWVRRDDGLCSMVLALRGFAIGGIASYVDTNALGRHAAVPWVETQKPAVRGQIYAAAVVLSRDLAELRLQPELDMDVTGNQVSVRWPDGTQDIVDLAATDDTPPAPVTADAARGDEGSDQ